MHRIADYEFIRSLGSGNHGRYFLARRPPRLPVDAEFVAVKVLMGESTADTFRRATRELKAVARVSSPYLATLYDAGQHDGVFYYSTEYQSGGTLAAPAYAMDTTATLRALAETGRALAALHMAGLVHGAVKPANVLLSAGGARLSDPGLTRIFMPGVTLTGIGPVATLEYTDPELLHGEPPGPHNDVWSLGVSLHRLLTGAGVYGELPATDGLAALRRVISAGPQVAPGLSARLTEIVNDCLAPASRRPSAVSVADRVSAAAV